MKIYRIHHDPMFQTLVPAIGDSGGLIKQFGAERKWDQWEEAFGPKGPLLRVEDPAGTRQGNFFLLHPGALVYDWRVADAADEISLLQDDMEYLPARLEDPVGSLCIQNPMGYYPCFDHDRSEFTTGVDGEIVSIQKHAFHVGRILDSTVFKIPETRSDTIYALSGRGDGDLFEFYHSHSYTGLLFEEVWSD
jgi:hypothetical protein